MSFKKIYIASNILTLFCFSFLFFKAYLIYPLYGYDPSIIGSSDFEAFTAFEKTKFAMNLCVYFSRCCTIISFILCVVAIYLRVYTKYLFAYLVLAVNLVLLGIYYFASLFSGVPMLG